MDTRKINFAAGPAKLPEEVLIKAQDELRSHGDSGISVLEMSHRSPEFEKILSNVKDSIHEIVHIPSNYKIIFKQGGGSGQFAAVPLNLMARSEKKSADYFVTGTWSLKAKQEASKYGEVREVFTRKSKQFVDIPDKSEWQFNPEASYVYYCDNETIHGVEFPEVPEPPAGVPLVCDMSSNFMSRPIDVSKYGVIFAGAQKNVGCAGVVIVIIREDLLDYALPICPIIMEYKVQVANDSLYNTPPTFGIYILGLVKQWILANGGLEGMEKRSYIKSKMVYDTIAESDGFYTSNIADECRSRMNVVLRIKEGDEALEKQFAALAQEKGMIQLKGHRSVGGLRVSLYNAIDPTEVAQLVEFMKDFQKQHA